MENVTLHIKQEDIDLAIKERTASSVFNICRCCVIYQAFKRQFNVSIEDLLEVSISEVMVNRKAEYRLDIKGMEITSTKSYDWHEIKPQDIKLIKIKTKFRNL